MTNYTILMNEIIEDVNLKYDEKMLFIGLTRYHNKDYGYAFPKYEELLAVMGTKRREKVKSTLDKLVAKGYIRIEKVGRNSRYFILKVYSVEIVEEVEIPSADPTPIVEEVIEDPIVEEVQPKKIYKDSNGNLPIDGQMDIEDYVRVDGLTYTDDDKIKLVKTKIKFLALDQIEKIKSYSYNDIKRVMDSADVVNFNYLINGLSMKKKNAKSFNNFEPRDYNYDVLERILLGWDKVPDDYVIPTGVGNYTSNNSKRFSYGI